MSQMEIIPQSVKHLVSLKLWGRSSINTIVIIYKVTRVKAEGDLKNSKKNAAAVQYHAT